MIYINNKEEFLDFISTLKNRMEEIERLKNENEFYTVDLEVVTKSNDGVFINEIFGLDNFIVLNNSFVKLQYTLGENETTDPSENKVLYFDDEHFPMLIVENIEYADDFSLTDWVGYHYTLYSLNNLKGNEKLLTVNDFKKQEQKIRIKNIQFVIKNMI